MLCLFLLLGGHFLSARAALYSPRVVSPHNADTYSLKTFAQFDRWRDLSGDAKVYEVFKYLADRRTGLYPMGTPAREGDEELPEYGAVSVPGIAPQGQVERERPWHMRIEGTVTASDLAAAAPTIPLSATAHNTRTGEGKDKLWRPQPSRRGAMVRCGCAATCRSSTRMAACAASPVPCSAAAVTAPTAPSATTLTSASALPPLNRPAVIPVFCEKTGICSRLLKLRHRHTLGGLLSHFTIS